MSSEFNWFGNEVAKKMELAIQAGLISCAREFQAQAKLLTPVKTGRLRQSISYKTRTSESGELKEFINNDEAIIGTNVEYAPYVEFGTKFQKPKSYLRASMDILKNRISNLFKNEYDRIMK